MNKIAVLVLAAGKSTRMNSIKQLEKINDKTLLDITLEKMKSIFSDSVFCVLGANIEFIKKEITIKNINFINNKNYEDGLSSSIIAGLHHFKKNNLVFDGLLIVLADQPAIELSYLKLMTSLFEKNNTKIIASNYGKKLGVPAIFPKVVFKELFLIKGDKGAKDFINKRKEEVVSVTAAVNLIDIDTQEDLKNYINADLKNTKTTNSEKDT